MTEKNWWAIFETATGKLVAITQEYREPLLAGLSSVSIGLEAPDMDTYQWDQSSHALVPRTPQRLLPKWYFIQRFTDTERRAFFGFPLDSTKIEAQRKIVSALMWYLLYLDTINLDDTSLAAGIEYLETVGILATGRAAQILS